MNIFIVKVSTEKNFKLFINSCKIFWHHSEKFAIKSFNGLELY